MNIFTLLIGDRFIFDNNTYKLINFKEIKIPKLGKVNHAICYCETIKKEQHFTRNWEVEKLND